MPITTGGVEFCYVAPFAEEVIEMNRPLQLYVYQLFILFVRKGSDYRERETAQQA